MLHNKAIFVSFRKMMCFCFSFSNYGYVFQCAKTSKKPVCVLTLSMLHYCRNFSKLVLNYNFSLGVWWISLKALLLHKACMTVSET